MEIILSVHKDLELELCETLAQRLVYKAGFMGFIHTVPPENREKLWNMVQTETDCLLVIQVEEMADGNFISMDCLREMQGKKKNIFFLILGKTDADCRRAVQCHLRMAGYFNQDEETLGNKITDSILEVARMEIPFCDGIFVSREGEYMWLPYSAICCIEKIKGTHYCDVKCAGKTYSLRGNIRELEHCMGDSFWKCRASTLINLRRIMKIDCASRTVFLDGGHWCTYPKEYSTVIRRFLKNSFESVAVSV